MKKSCCVSDKREILYAPQNGSKLFTPYVHRAHHAERVPSSSIEQKLEQSVTTLTDKSKKQHRDIMAALRNVRVYKQTLGQDQLDR